MPSSRSSAAAAERRDVGRAASTTRRPSAPAHARTVASAMSLVPPSTSTDWGWPRELITVLTFRHIWSRRDRSEQNTRSGLTRRSTPRKSSRRGYIRANVPGRQAGVLGQVHPTAARRGPPRRALAAGQPSAGLGGHVECERPPLHREREHPVVARAEPLEHGEERGVSGAGDALEHRAAAPPRRSPARTNWYCRKPARAVDPVPPAHDVERMEERRDGLELALHGAGAPCGTRAR